MTLRIAIVGSGIAGLSCAWKLAQPQVRNALQNRKVHISLFEKASTLGLGSQGIQLESMASRMDIPPRVINREHYPHLYHLLKETQTSTYDIQQSPRFLNNAHSEYLRFNTRSLFGKERTLPALNKASIQWVLKHARMLKRWQSLIHSPDLSSTCLPHEDLGHWLDRHFFSSSFCSEWLYPIWALMCSCQTSHVRKFPALAMLELMKHFSGNTPTQRITGGTRALEKKLIQHVDEIHTHSEVVSLSNTQTSVQLTTRHNIAQSFDHIILATEPLHAAHLVKSIDSKLNQTLKKIPQQSTNMILHRDENLMPKNKRHWSVVNLYSFCEPQKHSFGVGLDTLNQPPRYWSNIWMNPIEQNQSLPFNVFQSWDPCIELDENKVLAHRSFTRTLATPESIDAIQHLKHDMAAQPNRRVWLAGTYMGSGVPLLETAVESAEWLTQAILNIENNLLEKAS